VNEVGRCFHREKGAIVDEVASRLIGIRHTGSGKQTNLGERFLKATILTDIKKNRAACATRFH